MTYLEFCRHFADLRGMDNETLINYLKELLSIPVWYMRIGIKHTHMLYAYILQYSHNYNNT
jgi:hypothetical protein